MVMAARSMAQSSDRVRVAFIGVGNRGGYLLGQMLKLPGVDVVAISDLDAARMAKAIAAVEAAGGKAEGYPDFRKMLDRKDIDAVVIATPVDTHKAIGIAALEVGKNVYCEKPMAHTAEDVRMLYNAAKSAKGIFQTGFQLRHDPNRAAAMKYVKDGKIGRVLFLQGYRHSGDLPYDTPWLFDKSRSGDIIVEQACHILDLMTWAAGKPPLRCFGTGGINLFKDVPPGRSVMDNYALVYEFPDDIRLSFSQLYFDPPGFSGVKERVFGSEGAVDLPSATFYPLKSKAGVKLEVPEGALGSDAASLAAFLENARGKKTPLNNADSGRLATLVAMMGRKAIYEKRVVTWEEMAL
jgi:predicted dehydrogenase